MLGDIFLLKTSLAFIRVSHVSVTQQSLRPTPCRYVTLDDVFDGPDFSCHLCTTDAHILYQSCFFCWLSMPMYNCLLNADVSKKPQAEYAPKARLSFNILKLLLLCPLSVIAALGSFLSRPVGVLLFFLPLSFFSQQPCCPSTLPLFCRNPS